MNGARSGPGMMFAPVFAGMLMYPIGARERKRPAAENPEAEWSPQCGRRQSVADASNAGQRGDSSDADAIGCRAYRGARCPGASTENPV
jgi:hypothetical protein